MRSGQNPLKWRKDEFQPSQVTVVTMVHIPALEGYWVESLDVLKMCLNSLRKHTGRPFDLMVLDNASCREVQDYLIEERRNGLIDYMVLSRHNMRKLGAVEFLLQAAPGEVVSLTDSDVYFAPGWLEASLAVLKEFPEAGQVTALPTADRAKTLCQSTYRGIEKAEEVKVEKGCDLIDEKYVRAHAASLGLSRGEYQRRLEGRMDVRISRNGVNAFVSAQDFQYTTTKKVIQSIWPLPNAKEVYKDAVYSPIIEAAIDAKGLWRLSTEKYYAHHMGNRIPSKEELVEVFGSDFGTLGTSERNIKEAKARKRIYNNRHVRKAMKRLNSWSYSRLYE